MLDHVLMLAMAVLAVVLASEGGEASFPTVRSSGAEFSRAGSLHPEEVTNLEVEEEVEGRETNGGKVMNMVMAKTEIVSGVPEGYNWDLKMKDQKEEEEEEEGGEERKGRWQPHNTRKTRKHRGRRRKWKNKASKKYYRGNRTKKLKKKSGGGGPSGQRQWSSPNQREAWVAQRTYRSVDPQRVKVRRHLVRQHNLLRSKVDPPAGDMLAVKWYKTAAEQAQAWAEQCGRHTHTEHPSVRWTSSYGACGQNVFVSPTKKRWSQVLQHWWAAGRDFRYGGANNMTVVAAYTQMAWYNSHQLGCGFSQCHTPGGDTFFRYVCNYCPVGNDPARLSRPYSEGSRCSLCPGACRSLCPRRRCPLCTNSCTYSDLWANCRTLDQQWHEWLCNTKTSQGVERFKNCRATCQCVNEIT